MNHLFARKIFLMRNLFLGICIVVLCITVSSCLKNSSSGSTTTCTPVTITTKAPDSEVVKLKTYLDSNHIIATQDSRGFFYTMDTTVADTAATAHATTCSYLAVVYKGKFLNGQVFDSSVNNTATTVRLVAAIYGWQEAVPLMRRNASMVLYLPPSLAYGAAGASSNGVQVVPGNAYLIFNIKLYDFTSQ